MTYWALTYYLEEKKNTHAVEEKVTYKCTERIVYMLSLAYLLFPQRAQTCLNLDGENNPDKT